MFLPQELSSVVGHFGRWWAGGAKMKREEPPGIDNWWVC